MPTTIDYATWAWRVVSWDGIVPAMFTVISIAVAWLVGDVQWIAEILMVALPIVAFFLRMAVGGTQIWSNHCGVMMRRMQMAALGIAVLIFLFADFFVVLLAFLPKHKRQMPAEDIPIYVLALVIYLLAAMFAMYPGKVPQDLADGRIGRR